MKFIDNPVHHHHHHQRDPHTRALDTHTHKTHIGVRVCTLHDRTKPHKSTVAYTAKPTTDYRIITDRRRIGHIFVANTKCVLAYTSPAGRPAAIVRYTRRSATDYKITHIHNCKNLHRAFLIFDRYYRISDVGEKSRFHLKPSDDISV